MSAFEISSEEEMRALAASLANKAACKDVFLLDGPLGAGKSAFARGFIQSLCGNDMDVPSPTFTLVQTYDSAKGSIWHFDLYRLEQAHEIFEIGWEEALATGIVIVEWPQRLGPYIPKNAKWITIDVTGNETRKVELHDQA